MIAPHRLLRAPLLAFSAMSFSITAAEATTYNVGPGQPYATIGAVPWYTLKAGDTVFIHWKPTPYFEKILISGQGTAAQWIRVLGVPDPATGALPIISGNGATTSTNMHYRWPAVGAGGIQNLGLIQVAARADADIGGAVVPKYIEIANLQVQDAYPTYNFTGENGQQGTYNGFASCVYARSAQNFILRDSILTNCGQGFYNWTADGSGNNNLWWNGLAENITLRGNYFHNNGFANSDTEHQTYTEAKGVVIEFNRFGPQRTGSLGSQIKDRSAGTVIRYNYVEQSKSGYIVDLVEPQASAPSLIALPQYKQAFVYGNTFVNKGVYNANYFHWNGDQYGGNGRAAQPGGKLFLYNNTFVTVANRSDVGFDVASSKFRLLNEHHGGFDCPPGSLPGAVDVRNNVFAILPRTAGSPIPRYEFGYCGKLNYTFVNNWISPGYTVNGVGSTGGNTNVSPANNGIGFVSEANNDYHLAPGSSAIGIGGLLAPEVTNNSLGQDLTPSSQYIYHSKGGPRPSHGLGSDAGAFARETAAVVAAVLPYARSVQVGAPATAFSVMLNTSSLGATGCAPAQPDNAAFPHGFTYQTTNAQNQLIGTPNTPAPLAAGGTQNFVFGITPVQAFGATEFPIVFSCADAVRAPSTNGVNTFILSASSVPGPDLVAIGATPSNDGIVAIAGNTGTGVLAMAAVNIAAGGAITATADDGGRGLPIALTICQSNPATAACTNPVTPGASAVATVDTNQTVTYTVFVRGTGAVPFDPANNRLFIRLKTADGITRGATNVAVRTVPADGLIEAATLNPVR